MDVQIRQAHQTDLPAIVAMLSQDSLGEAREQPGDLAPYRRAFDEIEADANNMLLVGHVQGKAMAVLQITFIPGLTYRGGRRALVEGVRVHGSLRGEGVGSRMMQKAIDVARAKGCHLVQLTSDLTRPDAKCFYESLGFKATHRGFKLHLKTQ